MSFYTFRNSHIPERMADEITAYIHNGRPLGGFLHKVFCNDFVEAISRADNENNENMDNLQAYAAYLHNECPMDCWGSEEAVKHWIKVGGLEGLRRKGEEG